MPAAQIDVAVNAPEPGTIKEFLANEEDTITVGQDLLKLELGGPPEGGEKQQGGSEPKAPAPNEQPTSSYPEPKKDEGAAPSPKKDEGGAKQDSAPAPPPKKEPEPPKEESKATSPSKEPPSPREPSQKPQEPKKQAPEPKESAPLGNREERRV